MDGCVWYDIKGYEGIYQISSTNLIRSLNRIVNGRKISGKMISVPNISTDIKAIRLTKEGTRKTFSIDDLLNLRILKKRSVKVRCIDEGKEFPTETAAAEYYGMHVSSVSDCLHDGKEHCGHRFERI